MKNLINKIRFYLTPTKAFKDAVQKIAIGDIIYISQGGHPHKEVAGYQFVTKVENEKLEVTFGGGKLSNMKRMQDDVTTSKTTFRMLYWHDVIINPETGFIKNHGDLRVNEIIKVGKSIYLFPSNYFYYTWMYGSTLVILFAFLALCWLSAKISPILPFVVVFSLCAFLIGVVFYDKFKVRFKVKTT